MSSMLNLKMNSFTDTTFGEPEQDASSALIELDKGLRSSKIGEQCQAIIKFPRLFEKYPFPILINSSLLKLADVFRTGNNFLRVWVLQVCQQSDKHLDKILNVDEFVKRIYSVMYSNDPVAKALTLRTLGSVARIIPERKQVHHSIRRSLDCHDLVQVESAIYAAQMFAAQSKGFSIFLCSKISDMIRGQSTPASMKLQLIPILQHMHHDISTASLAKELCMELLKSYPAVEFVQITLSSSTTLASATLIDIPAQVSLLIRYLLEDPRLTIKKHALQLLHSLAKKGAHLWPMEATKQLVDNTIKVLNDTAENTNLIIQTLDVLEVLSQSAVTCDANVKQNSPLFSLCCQACYYPDPIVAVKAVTILARIACYCYEESLPVYNIQDIVSCLESLIMLLAVEDKYLYQFKVCLAMIVKLCRAERSHCSYFADAIGSTLTSTNNKRNNRQAVILCEALGAIGSLGENILLPLLPEILGKLEQTQDSLTKIMLCTLLFQIVAAGFEWNQECLNAIKIVVKSVNDWDKYRIARGATRYGHHKIATEIFASLKEAVASEPLHFWILGLELVTSAEGFLLNETEDKDKKTCAVSKLTAAITRYSSASASLKAACSPIRSLQFTLDYAKLRCEFLQALVQLLHNCRSLCTSPPYAIAAHLAHTSKDELQRYGRVTTQLFRFGFKNKTLNQRDYLTNKKEWLRKSVMNFKNCADSYQNLYQSAFDADPDSLCNIKALQELCLLMAHSVQKVSGGLTVPSIDPIEVTNIFHFGDSLEMQLLAKTYMEIQKLCPTSGAENDSSNSSKSSGITHLRVNCLIEQINLLASGKIRFPFPRYFFQVLQTTDIKLSVWPQPRASGEPISLPQGTQFSVKVEGVLRHGHKASFFRAVSAVCVIITTYPITSTSKNNIEKKDSNVFEVEQTVVPHRDFFACEFLLPLGIQNANTCANNPPASSGQHQVTVTANIVDESGNIWKCGPQVILQVKVHEEPAKRKI